MHLTITYSTCREEPMFEWFADSLVNECAGDFTDKRLVIVDFYADTPGRRTEFARKLVKFTAPIVHTTPKPTVWQGPSRLTSRDYFAAANARNTAICHAPDGWIAYVDDVSVLIPGWLSRIQLAIASNYIVLGAYQKVSQLHVINGVVHHCTDLDQGYDSRLKHLNFVRDVVPAPGSWFFGCSLAAPVDAFLKINGWDEDCDSMGAEDYPCGFMLAAAGYDIRYDPSMMTYESEEHHFLGRSMVRKGKLNIQGHPSDGHAYIAMLMNGRNRAPNYFGEGGLAALRSRILAGEPFPPVGIPDRDWRDGQPLSEL